jgi:hypothetical protein
MSHADPNVAEPAETSPDPHAKVGAIVMWIIAITLVVCTAGVLLFKGVNAMPYDWIGVIGAAIFAVAAVAMTRIPSGH